MIKLMTIVLGLPAIMRLLVVVAATLFACRGWAQNNPYKINDQLYKMYSDAYLKRTSKECIGMSQKMYKRAVEMNDRKAQCLALTIPVIHYSLHVDEQNFEPALKALQDKSLATGYEQYYYYGVTNKMNMLINLHRTTDAFEYVSKIDDEVRRRKSVYGTYTTLSCLGQLHYICDELQLAIDCYKRALQLGTDYLKDQDMAPQYRKISECYEMLGEYHNMLEYAEKGFHESRTMAAKLRVARSVCYAAFMLGRYDTFLKYYNFYCSSEHVPDAKSASLHERELAILKLIYDRRFDEARKAIASINEYYLQHKRLLEAEVCRFSGDYAGQASLLSKMYRMRIEATDSVRSLSFVDVNSRIANMVLEFENRRLALDHQKLLNEQQRIELHNSNLELANTQLSLSNSDLELQRTKLASSLMRFSYNNKQLEAAKLRGQIAAQQAELHTHDLMIAAIFIVCIVIMVAVAAFTYNHNMLMARLRRTNDTLARNNRELSEAKEKAEAANHAKTAFINNMGNDIRHPLAEVARYSRIIADSSASTSAEERRSNAALLNANTQALLNIVDKVIDKAHTAV